MLAMSRCTSKIVWLIISFVGAIYGFKQLLILVTVYKLFKR